MPIGLAGSPDYDLGPVLGAGAARRGLRAVDDAVTGVLRICFILIKLFVFS